MNRRLARIASILLVVMLAIGVFGVFAASFGPMDHEAMTGCALMHLDVVCAMNPLEHVSLLLDQLSGVVSTYISVILLFVLTLSANALRRFSFSSGLIKLSGSRHRLFHDEARMYHPLFDALSLGILHSKAY